ncbi:histidine phosphatase family protein [Chloroflexota bacterium]
MLEIILARHGETDWNAAEIFRGTVDVALNETGIKQAALLGEYLSKFDIDAVYSSPLQRALKTAGAIAGLHALEVNTAYGLIDFDYGEWQGLSHQEVRERYQELYAGWINHPDRVRMPAGESLADVRERAVALVDGIVAGCGAGRVVLVSHRVVQKVLICALLGLDNSHFWNVKLDTCGITSFCHERGRFILTRYNDTSFLQSISGAPLADF